MEGKQASKILRQMGESDNWDMLRLSILDDILTAVESRRTCYSSSFSSKGDALSQWRGYGDEGRGVAIGFDIDELKKIRSPLYSEEIALVRVLYKELDQKTLLGDEYSNLGEEIEAEARNRTPRSHALSVSEVFQETRSQNRFNSRVSSDIYESLAKKMFTLKPHGFHEEAEWRLIQIADPMAKSSFRSRGLDIAPYRKMPLSARSITEIVLGPRNSTPNRVAFAMTLGKFENVSVRRSKLSYR